MIKKREEGVNNRKQIREYEGFLSYSIQILSKYYVFLFYKIYSVNCVCLMELLSNLCTALMCEKQADLVNDIKNKKLTF